MRAKRVSFLAILAAVLVFPPPDAAHAQAYPNKPVKILIGFQPGGPTDLIGRVWADHMSKTTGQPHLIESKAGAGGIVAGQLLAQSPPDGYTLYLNAFGIIGAAKAMNPTMAYDPATAFAPISMMVHSALIIEVAAQTPVNNWQEFVPWAKANSGKLNHGSPGTGTQPHLAGELLRQRLGFESQHIAYRGTAPFMQGMIQKELQWAVDAPSGAIPLVKGGHVRVIAVASEKRWPDFPDAPTLTELGMQDAVWPSWFGLVAPAGTPKPILEQVSAAVDSAWKLPENVEKLRNVGFLPWATKPDETAKIYEAERKRWGEVIRANNIKAE